MNTTGITPGVEPPAKVHKEVTAPSTDVGELPSGDASTRQRTPSPGRGTLLNVNTATVTELELLPGIGPETARRIVAYRTKEGPFRTVEDLDKVAGIGPKTLDKIRPLVRVR